MTDLPNQDDLEIQTDAEEEADVEHFRFRVGKNLVRRVDQYLTDRVSYLSRSGVQRLIDEGLVKLNGKVLAKASYHPHEGDIIEMVAPPKPISELIPEPIPLDIIYEDEHFLAINKQANLMVHPARGVWTGTLVNGLVYYGAKWSTINGNWRPGILHRLDRNTTGVMLVAKSDEAHWRMARQFENRTIQKTYVAVCHGIPGLRADVIDMPIGRDRYVREKQAVRKIENGGKPAVTTYEVMEKFNVGGTEARRHEGTKGGEGDQGDKERAKDEGGRMKEEAAEHRLAADATSQSAIGNRQSAMPEIRLLPSPHEKDHRLPPPPAGKFSYIRLTPKTGRTHQLRVHMSAVGFPMVGDTMYGGRIFEAGTFRFDRQALHAHSITFTHPATLEKMTLTAPLPPDMERLMEILRG